MGTEIGRARTDVWGVHTTRMHHTHAPHHTAHGIRTHAPHTTAHGIRYRTPYRTAIVYKIHAPLDTRGKRTARCQREVR